MDEEHLKVTSDALLPRAAGTIVTESNVQCNCREDMPTTGSVHACDSTAALLSLFVVQTSCRLVQNWTPAPPKE